jgi:hypothetical protein
MKIAPLSASATQENNAIKGLQLLKLRRDIIESTPMIEWKYNHR